MLLRASQFCRRRNSDCNQRLPVYLEVVDDATLASLCSDGGIVPQELDSTVVVPSSQVLQLLSLVQGHVGLLQCRADDTAVLVRVRLACQTAALSPSTSPRAAQQSTTTSSSSSRSSFATQQDGRTNDRTNGKTAVGDFLVETRLTNNSDQKNFDHDHGKNKRISTITSGDGISPPPVTVRISCTLAANLGCAWGHQQMPIGWLEPYDHTLLSDPACAFALLDATNDPEDWILEPAERVTLQCLGKPTTTAVSSSSSSSSTVQPLVWPRPSNGRWIQKHNLLKVRGRDDRRCYFYHVVDIQSTSKNLHGYYKTNNATIYQFLEQHANRRYCRRLPPLLLRGTKCITPSASTTKVATSPSFMDDDATVSIPESSSSATSIAFPHPNLHQLMQAMKGVSIASSPNERVLHIVGTRQQHDVAKVVQAAAHVLGLQYQPLDGLAAHAATFTTTTTGSLLDKMAGLSHAVRQAHSCAPCVLHWMDADLEFRSTSHDASQRHHEEQRLWATLLQALVEVQEEDNSNSHEQKQPAEHEQIAEMSTNAKMQPWPLTTPTDIDMVDETDVRWTPPVIVILSTTQPLTKTSPTGPLVQHIVYDPVALTLPDDAYAEFVWNQGRGQFFHAREQDCVKALDVLRQALAVTTATSNSSNTVLRNLLVGRSVRDIQCLQEQWCEVYFDEFATMEQLDDEVLHVDNPQQVVDALSQLCQEYDEQCRKQAKTSSSAVEMAHVTWDDVGGLAQVRREILDTIELPLLYPHFFPNGGRSGILLYGPPGTGKTLIAKAVATECQIPFLSVKGPELLGSYVGESEANVRAVFATAREAALSTTTVRRTTSAAQPNQTTSKNGQNPQACLVFFDELDSLAPRRDDTASGSGGGVMDRVVATLAAELDKGQVHPHQKSESKGGNNSCHIFVLGATNRPDLLDPALLRPGRFDRMVYLGVASTAEDRARILAAQIRNLKLAEGSPAEIANAVVGRLPNNLTGADLSSIASGALMLATQRLCAEADEEVNILQQIQQELRPEETVRIERGRNEEQLALLDQVLSDWDDDRLTPVVTIQDLLEASKGIIPSVSEAELERYERLRLQFSSSAH